MRNGSSWAYGWMLAVLMAGCGQAGKPATSGAGGKSGTDTAASATPAETTAPDAAYLLAEKPAEVQGVAAARKNDPSVSEVTVEGRIGGSETPFVEGVAAFTIVDPAIPHCAPDEGCPTPWDYCCKTGDLKDNSALVKIVGADGTPVAKDARTLLGVKELSRVVVHGKAQRDEDGNLTILADKLYVAQK